jgi:hypothetical protein
MEANKDRILAIAGILLAIGAFMMAVIGLPTQHGTPPSAYPPTINGQ